MAPMTRSRRSPMQERSQETVQRVLDAASALLAAGSPIAALTTAQIAAEAGLSVGGLYRFFPDKQAIVDAIAVRHMELFQEALAGQVLADFPAKPADLLAAVIDGFVAYLEANPDFRTLAFGDPGGGRSISRMTREAYAGEQAAELLTEFAAEAYDLAPTPDFLRRLRIATEAGDRLLGYAFEQPGPEERTVVIDEAKRLLAGYLFPDRSES